MDSLLKKIDSLCKLIGIENDDEMIKAYANAYKQGLTQVLCLRVRDDYFKLSLQERRDAIGSPCNDVRQLTKCLLYENKNAPPENRDFPFSRYYLLIYQYTRKFSNPKLHKHVRDSRLGGQYSQLTKQDYDWGYVEEDVAKKILQADFNGMSPIGLSDRTIPIIIDSNIIEEGLQYIFIGGMDPLIKVRVSVDILQKAFNADVLLITDPLKASLVDD